MVVVVVFSVRLLWMHVLSGAVGTVAPRLGAERRTDRREQLVLGWGGMRGALSIAAALSLPFAQRGRGVVIFLAFAVTFATLVAPGLTLATLIRRVGLGQSENRLRQAADARLRVARAALSQLDRIGEDGGVSERTLARVRDLYETRAGALEARLGDQHGRDSATRMDEECRVRGKLMRAQREALRRLRAERAAPAELLLEIERDLDLEASRLRAG